MECTQVQLIHNGADPGDWSLEFSGPGFKFEVAEPYMCTAKEWEGLTFKDTRLTLYQGNGEGSISAEGDLVTFIAAPSGRGGDVSATLYVRAGSMRDLLKEALYDARERWLFFAKEAGD